MNRLNMQPRLSTEPASSFPFFPQGCLVQWEVPNARAPEPTGLQQGIVISSSTYNAGRTPFVMVCPLVKGDLYPYTNEQWGVPSGFNKALVFQPALTQSVHIGFNDLRPIEQNLESQRHSARKPQVILPYDITASIIQNITEIIRPGYNKIGDAHIFSYGKLMWFRSIPYMDCMGATPKLALILTPQRLAEELGVVSVMQGRRPNERQPQRKIYFDLPGFVSTAFNLDLQIIAPQPRAFPGEDNPVIQVTSACMTEVAQKLTGRFSPTAFTEVMNQSREKPLQVHRGTVVHGNLERHNLALNPR